MNNVALIGRLTREPEVRYTNDNLAVARFTLAVNRQKKGEVDYPNCVAFGKSAELVEQYVHKGSRIGVVGRLQTGSYEKDGEKRYTTDVIVDKVEFLDSKEDKQDRMAIPKGFEATDEELPF